MTIPAPDRRREIQQDNKNPWKNKSVASGLSVIDFEYGERAKRRVSFLLSILYYLLPLFSLEDSTTLLCSFAFGSVRTRSKGSRIKPMRRILSFHGFNFVLLLGIGFTTDCICAFTALDDLQQELIRDNPSARQAQRNPARHNKNPWKEQIRRISFLSVIDFWTWRVSQRRVSTSTKSARQRKLPGWIVV